MTRQTLWAHLADAPWVTQERLRRIAQIFAGCAILTLAGFVWVHTRAGITSTEGVYLGADFINYWSGAHVAAEGHPAQVYDLRGFIAWQRAHSAPNAEIKWYSYPPTALLMTLPLALMNYKAALAAWLVAGWVLCWLLLKRVVNWDTAAIAVLGTPASLINALSGQNGQFSAAFLCGGIMLLETHPIAAGLLFGLLCFKPHLAVLVPIVLAVGGYWRSFAAAAVTSLVAIAASWMMFGTQTWMSFLHTAPINALLMENDAGLWRRMPTVFSMIRLAGGPVSVAYAAQIVSALAAVFVSVRIWRSQTPLSRKGAVLILATFLVTPYAWDYDLVSLTFAAAWLAIDGLKEGFVRWEKTCLVAVIVFPLYFSMLGRATHFQIGPALLWPMLILAARVQATRGPGAEPAVLAK